MQFIDLSAQRERIRDDLNRRIAGVIESGKYINGPEVKELEERLAGFAGVKYAVGCSSGTDALLMPLMCHEVGPGDAVFTTTFTFIATAEVIALLGAVPVFVDCEHDTFNIDVEKLEASIVEVINKKKLKPRGIIPVDLFGQCADYNEINAIAKKYNLFILSDSAQSFGAEYKGRKACSLAEVSATSFYPSKPLGCYGDGGMIFTDDKSIYEKLISIREHGQGEDKYKNVRVGINGRLDSIQAAVLLAKMEIFDEEIRLRQKVAGRYNAGLSGKVETPFIKEYNLSTWAQYSIVHPERDRLIAKLKENGIQTMIYYPVPLHLQEAFSYLGYREGAFPVSERLAKEIFSLPTGAYLEEEDQEKVIKFIKVNID